MSFSRRKTPTLSLTTYILGGMLLGILVGSLMNYFAIDGWPKKIFLAGIIEIGGRVFLSSLQLLVVPMVLVSLVVGVGGLQNMKKLGRMGTLTMLLYLATTALALSIALVFAEIIDPGKNLHLLTHAPFQSQESPSLVDVIANIFPNNPIKSMANGEMLQIIVFAILLGIGINLSGAHGKRVLVIFEDFNEIILRIVLLLIHMAPIGVFCLLAKVFAQQGFAAILPMAKYFFTVLLVLLFHAVVVYGSLLKFWAKLRPLQFWKKFSEVLVFAFSTSSSNATIPINLEVCEKKLGIDNSVAAFTIPLGATINMDGTAIMQGVASVFVAQVYGINLEFSQYLLIILTATLASIGTAGVPGVGLIMLTMVFHQVGLPVEGIGMIMGVDRLLDMSRTAVNVSGDAVISCIVAKDVHQFNQQLFDSDLSEALRK